MAGGKSILARVQDNPPNNVPDYIAEQVRNMITTGTLSAGVHLGQTELADQFSTSRVPVREALKLLAAEGIVTHDQNRGFYVSKLSSGEARQLYRIRQLIEAEVLSTVRWPGEEQLAELGTIVLAAERAHRAGDMVDWARHHRAFREAVFALSSDTFIVGEALRLWSLADRYRSLLAATPHPSILPNGQMTDQHLLDALAEKDRRLLLEVFEQDRGKIVAMLVKILEARGL